MNRVILLNRLAFQSLVQSFRPNQVFNIKLNGVAPDQKVMHQTSMFFALAWVIFGVLLGGRFLVGCLLGTRLGGSLAQTLSNSPACALRARAMNWWQSRWNATMLPEGSVRQTCQWLLITSMA